MQIYSYCYFDLYFTWKHRQMLVPTCSRWFNKKQSLLPLLFDIYSTNREQSKAVNSKTFFLQNFFQLLHNWSTFNNIKNFDLFYKIKHESKRFLKVITPIFILWSIPFSVHLSNILICFNFFRVDCVTFYFRFQLL